METIARRLISTIWYNRKSQIIGDGKLLLLIIIHLQSNSFSNFYSTLDILYHSISALELLVLHYQLELHNVTLTKIIAVWQCMEIQRSELQHATNLEKEVLFCNIKNFSILDNTSRASYMSSHYILLLLQAATKSANWTPSDIIPSIFSKLESSFAKCWCFSLAR